MFNAVNVHVEYIVKIKIKFSLTSVNFVGANFTESLHSLSSTSLATRQPVQPSPPTLHSLASSD